MDPERLKRLASTVRKCIQFQEVTETSEMMDSGIVLNIHYNTTNGEHNPNPNVAPRLYTNYLAATQALREGLHVNFPPIPALPKEVLRGGGLSTAGSVGTSNGGTALSGSIRPPGPPVPAQLPPLAVDVMSPCQRIKGLVPASEHTFGIYKWLQKGRDIADPRVHTEVRRARKENTAGRRGQGNVPTSPRSTAATNTPDEVGDDRQFLNAVVVIYGRVNFLIQDEMYFRDDGQLVLIDRFLLQPVDAASPQYLADKASFFKLGRSQVDRVNEKHAVIDFSFKEMKEPMDALRVTPITGDPHRPRPIFKPPTHERNPEAVTFSNAENTQQVTRKLIVAKNRKGEEEAYEFEIKNLLKGDTEDKKTGEEIMMEQLAAKLANKYDGEVVRMCNNNMSHANNLLQVLRNLVANHFLTVQWVDLSSNFLTTIPDLSSLPLKTLYLHANKISDWQVIEERVCSLPQLVSVTCHGNPIATANKDYKQQLLMRLQRAKALVKGSAPIKLVDFVAVSACDSHVATMYSHFTMGGTVPLLPKFPKDGTVSPRSSPRRAAGGGDSPRLRTLSPRR